MQNNLNIAILKNNDSENHLYWAKACETYHLNYDIINTLSADWLDEIQKKSYQLLLACPPGTRTFIKSMYDEKIYILDKVLKLNVYPNYDEISIHENKKYFSYWLKANHLPHQKTKVFYSKNEALEYVKTATLPLVFKLNIGASGKGVKILKDHHEIEHYINQIFTTGIKQNWGPNLAMGSYQKRILNIIKNPSIILKKIKIYKKNFEETQKGFLIVQDYVPHDFEWRIVKIGNYFFGHQKIKQGEKASGSKGILYTTPPDKLLDFVKNICEKNHFNTMAFDLFENENGGYLINEMQCIFGHVQDYICEKEGKAGAFIYENNQWKFQEGMFNSNLSYNLRLQNALEQL